MKKVFVYSTSVCPYCVQAKRLLESEGVPYEEIRLDNDPKGREELEKLTQRRTVPQIFIGDKHVGGFDDLRTLHTNGELNDWLKD